MSEQSWPSSRDILDAIKAGLVEALTGMLSEKAIAEAIRQGVYDSFPWPSEIRDAIYDGMVEATKGA